MSNYAKFMTVCGLITFFSFLGTVVPKESLKFATNVERDTVFITDTVYVNYPDTLDEWKVMMMAMIGTESEYNPHAYNPDGYYGSFQMSEWYLRKASQLTGKEINKENIHIFENALDAFLAMNDETNPEYDIDEAIRIHNPGGGNTYRNKILKRMEKIKKYENIRNKLLKAYMDYE